MDALSPAAGEEGREGAISIYQPDCSTLPRAKSLGKKTEPLGGKNNCFQSLKINNSHAFVRAAAEREVRVMLGVTMHLSRTYGTTDEISSVGKF